MFLTPNLDQWALVAQIQDDGPAKTTIEEIRKLSDAEIDALNDAHRTLASLTTASPYQKVLNACIIASRALESFGDKSTEAEEARGNRALEALRLSVAEMNSALDAIPRLTQLTETNPPNLRLKSATERLRSSAEWQLLSTSATDPETRLCKAPEPGQTLVLLTLSDGSSIIVQKLLEAILQRFAVITAELLVVSADRIN